MRSNRLVGLALLFLPACEMGKLFDSPPPAGESAHGVATDGAVRLTFTVQPGTVKVGDAIAPPVAVAAQDSTGATVTTFTGPITLAIDVGPGGALSGELTRDAVGGVSSFPNLVVDEKGTGYRLKASAPGLTDATSTSFEVVANDGGGGQQPTGITLVSGDGQVDTVGATLDPYVVLVTDASNKGVAGVTVRWSVTGGGSITPTSSTDATGHASATRVLGNTLGRQTAAATVTGLTGSPVSFSATALPGTPIALVFTQQPSGAAAGNAIVPPIEVTARDRLGNTATGFIGLVTLALQSNPVGGLLSGIAVRAAASGVATFPGLSIDRGGTGYTLSARAVGIPDAVSGGFYISAGPSAPPTMAAAAGTGQTDTAAARLPVAYQVRVTDAGGNPVAGMAVTWTVATGGGSISPGSSLTDAGGFAQSTHTLGTAAGVQTASASAAGVGGSPVTFAATALPATVSQLAILTQPTNPGTGATIAPAVSVAAVDKFGNRATNQSASVTASIVPLSGTPLATLSGTLTRPLTAGVATFDDLRISLPGLGYRLRLTAGALSVDSDPFNVL